MLSSQAPSTTLGNSQNETVVTYKTRAGAHHIRALNQVNPDILLIHQSKMVAFNIKTKSTDELEPVPRRVKAIFLVDLGRPL